MLLSTINTTAFHFITDFSFFFSFLSLPSVTHYWCPLFVCVFFPPTPLLILVFFSLFGQRQAKYTENRLKAIKARNEYLLALEATNGCVFKYYIHDLSDIIDVSIISFFDTLILLFAFLDVYLINSCVVYLPYSDLLYSIQYWVVLGFIPRGTMYSAPPRGSPF